MRQLVRSVARVKVMYARVNQVAEFGPGITYLEFKRRRRKKETVAAA